MMNMKKHFVLRNLLIDLLCAGLALIVFALFHHVLPRQQQGLGIVITNPNVKDSGNNTGESVMPEGVWLTDAMDSFRLSLSKIPRYSTYSSSRIS